MLSTASAQIDGTLQCAACVETAIIEDESQVAAKAEYEFSVETPHQAPPTADESRSLR
jgi:hypothetical protein